MLLLGGNLSDEQQKERNQITSALMIDNIMRRGEYAKFYQDLESASQDFTMVIKICNDFP
jgi:hypothetical protein